MHTPESHDYRLFKKWEKLSESEWNGLTIDLSNVEVLFRMTSDGLTEEEKVIFRDELIEFMKERKKLFDEDKK
ncbi:hypothetical protein EH70_07215 [Streptococcus equinus]|uniref:hypothetical protein n=1 Tax=Streptococcus equinus TaxID=1335 RepID=UPI0004DAF3A6|nr:hypothetical protein EH70_07215 [Streptococcus equinus]